ncbi:hypothetical protein [Sphingomonas oryzagri]
MNTIVTHSCGHQQSHALFGTFAADIEREARRLARRTCAACYREKRTHAAQADTVLLLDLPLASLEGSDKQVSWAETIRARRIAALIKAAGDVAPLAGRRDAKWWIDHRDAADAELLALAGAG